MYINVNRYTCIHLFQFIIHGSQTGILEKLLFPNFFKEITFFFLFCLRIAEGYVPIRFVCTFPLKTNQKLEIGTRQIIHSNVKSNIFKIKCSERALSRSCTGFSPTRQIKQIEILKRQMIENESWFHTYRSQLCMSKYA